ncbi:homoserine kinase [Gallicola sp. Sow4_E12]|uniref:homoserine kinase n=1 Tax=Gallicola sp. Sow4_E12 TaxID=3438785 RepID=UPI003F93328C
MLKIKVPASTANMGPGFDVLALSFKLYNEFIFEDSNELIINTPNKRYNNKNNLVYRTLVQVLEEKGIEAPALKLTMTNEIPISRGLGSSATCILAGVIAANRYLKKKMTTEEIYLKAVAIEGHCDNISSQFFGGLTLSMREEDRIFYRKANIPSGLLCTALIPDFTLSTKKARAVLLETVSLTDATYNLSHAMLFVESLKNGQFKDLKYFLKDKLHEPYRSSLIPNFDRIIQKAYDLGAYGAFLSGAGPTIMILRKNEENSFKKNIQNYLHTLEDQWKAVDLSIDNEGTIISQD